MKQRSVWFSAALALIWPCGLTAALGQGAPQIVWEAPNPNGIANNIVGVGWTPGLNHQVAIGSTDRWLRTRDSASGTLIYSILGPQHSRGGDQTIYSTDGVFLAVHNREVGPDYRVYRAADGTFLGSIVVTIDAAGLVHFTPDASLQSSVPKSGIMNRWRIEEFTVTTSTGVGYQTISTSINFSPDGRYQSIATQSTITILSRKDGSTLSSFPGGSVRTSTPVMFTPESAALAAWDTDSNRTTLFRVVDGAILRQFPDAVPEEGVAGIRFSPDGTRMVTTGYYAVQNGAWEQFGYIRFWRVADGLLQQQYDQHTGIAVTSPIAWSPDASRFIYGTYEGAVAVAQTPAP